MKSIILSIDGKWVRDISSGEKDLEIRRKFLQGPVKCYIYETRKKYRVRNKNGSADLQRTVEGRGAVVGEFICRLVDEFSQHIVCENVTEQERQILDNVLKKSCLKKEELKAYIEGLAPSLPFYGVHIDDLKIYNSIKPLEAFRRPLELSEGKVVLITKAPQNWCYAELNEVIK